jgi:hypothetical protein
MAHSQDIRAEVRRAYAIEALPLESLSMRYGVAVSTLMRWKKEAAGKPDDWDKARAAARLTALGKDAINDAMLAELAPLYLSILSDLKNETIPAIQKAEAMARLTDSHHKTMSIIAKTSPQVSKLAVAMEVLQLQANFIRAGYPHLVEPFSLMLDQFGAKLSEVFG